MTGSYRSLTRAGAVIAVVYALPLLGATPAQADSCPNAQFRAGSAANLPDCRAYEQVSSQNNDGQGVGVLAAEAGAVYVYPQTAPSGNGIGYVSSNSAYDNPSGSAGPETYVSTRGADGWSTTNITPPQNNPGLQENFMQAIGFSSDLSTFLFQGTVPLVPGPTAGVYNGYVRDIASGGYTLVSPNGPTNPVGNNSTITVDAASTDLSRVVFTSPYALTANAPSGSVPNVYLEQNGSLSLVSVLPNGTPASGATALAGVKGGDVPTASSGQDSQVYWTSGGPASVYLSTVTPSGAVSTVQVNASSDGTVDPNGAKAATLWAATSGDTQAFFTSPEKLTANATTGATDGGSDLYEYDAASGDVSDLTPDTNAGDANGAHVLGVVGTSTSGSVIYFVATGVLAAGGQSGQDNLYVDDNGRISYIGALAAADASTIWAWYYGGKAIPQTPPAARVTASGSDLVLTTTAQLTSFANNGQSEVYRYDLASGTLNCVSCDLGGQTPTSGAALEHDSASGNLMDALYLPSNLSSDGNRVFFQDAEALLPQANNGVENVYEWVTDGTGQCAGASQNGGCLYLVSDGQGANPTYFIDASPSGNDVFLLSADQLVSGAAPGEFTLYDARVNGGYPAPAAAVSCDSSASCEGVAGAGPSAPSTATVTFSGPANQSAPTTKPALAKVKVTHKAVKGDAFTLTVKVPASGRITVSGASLRTVVKSARKAGSYRVTVKLTARAKRALKRKRRMKVYAKVSYRPSSGRSSKVTAAIELKA